VCSLLGKLDFETFCEGYAAHIRWREGWSGDTGKLGAAIPCLPREGRDGRP
jgi:hypothetical protein